jgi:hypothetical protein
MCGQISFENAWLMHDAMNNASSNYANFDQFHIKASYMVMLSCFMYKIKLKRHCSSVNLEGMPNITETSHVMM